MINEDEIEMPAKGLADIKPPRKGRPKGTTKANMQKRRFEEAVGLTQSRLDNLDREAEKFAEMMADDIIDGKLASQALRKATADRVLEKSNRLDLAIKEDEKADENRQFNAHIVKTLRLGLGDKFDNSQDLFDREDCQRMWDKTLTYIKLCVEDGVRLTKAGFWTSIGVTKRQASEWRNGTAGTEEHQRFVGYIDNIFDMSNEMLGTHNRITAPTYIWNDKTKNNVVEKTKEEPVNDLSVRELSADEIADKWGHVVSDFNYDEEMF